MSVYGKGYFVTEQEQIEELNQKTLMESMLLEAANDGLYSITEANYTILPTFRNSKVLSDYEDIAEEAQELLKDNDMNKTYGTRVIRCLARLYDIIKNISALLKPIKTVQGLNYAIAVGVTTGGPAGIAAGAALAALVVVLSVIGYLLNRLISWALKWGQEKLAIKECDKMISDLTNLKSKIKDNKAKDSVEKTIEKIKDQKEKLIKANKNTKIKMLG